MRELMIILVALIELVLCILSMMFMIVTVPVGIIIAVLITIFANKETEHDEII